MHPAKEGFSALPFFDEFDLSTVDILLISQYVEKPVFLYIFICFHCGNIRMPEGASTHWRDEIVGYQWWNSSLALQPLPLSCIQEAQYNSILFVFRVPTVSVLLYLALFHALDGLYNQ